MTAINDLIVSLNPESGWRCRTGIVLVPPKSLSDLPNVGARHGLDTVDYASVILQQLPHDTQFVPLSVDSESERLRQISDSESGSPVLLIAQFDVALARLGTLERDRLWQVLYQYLTQTRHGLLFAMPTTAVRLLPEEILLENWRTQGRIALIDE